MPTRSSHNHPSNSQTFNSPNNSNQIPTMIQNSTTHFDINSYIGKTLIINQHHVVVEDILGQGGFAYVFLVRSSHQQRYALKRMYVNNEHDLFVCQREISILKEFSIHPHFVKYIDSSIQKISHTVPGSKRYVHHEKINDQSNDLDDDTIYEILLLTEYCSHGALVTRLNEQRSNGTNPIGERHILRVFADICQAVSACHHRRPQPILHRDIKLENILIDSQQSFVLCDFGSAIFLPASSTNEHQQHQINQLTTSVIQQLEEEIQRYTTLSYRAPEMIDLYSRRPITLKADIWAMGCLLYKLMYNIMPFGDSILAIQNGTFTLPDDMVQTYSRELNQLLRFILEIDLNKRPDIWQVSYLTYKLLGVECPIVNRCHSKVPDLSNVPMPLTESESRHQRAMALAAAKSNSNCASDEIQQLGTAVNPRERPRGIAAPSSGLINLNPSNQRVLPIVAPPPSISSTSTVISSSNIPTTTQNRSTHQRSGSAAQLMFDDDFSQYPSHALSLNNLPNTNTISTPKSTSSTAADKNVSRARPSPPSSISSASGIGIQKQLFPPPPTSTSSSIPSPIHQHRRSASQTMSPQNSCSNSTNTLTAEINNTGVDQRRHSVDASIKQNNDDSVVFIGEASSDDDDPNGLSSNLNKLKVHNHSTENVKSRESLILNEDDRLFTKTYMAHTQLKSDDEQSSSSSSSDEHEKTIRQKSKKKSQRNLTPLRVSHHGPLDEQEKFGSSPNGNNKNLVKRLIELCSLQQNDETGNNCSASKRKDSFNLAHENPVPMNDRTKSESDSNDSDSDSDPQTNIHNDHDKVGFDQLINEDSDDDSQVQSTIQNNSSKNLTTTSLFLSSRNKEQQYEHFQDSDDEKNDLKSSQTKSTSANATTKLFNIFTSNAKTNAGTDTKRILNEQNNQNPYSSAIEHDNPFLHAPFHHSTKTNSSTHGSSNSSINGETTNCSAFDPTSIVVGKRLSAFAPYQRQDQSTVGQVVDSQNISQNFNSTNKQKLPHSESYPPGTNLNPTSSIVSKDVFINAPFKSKMTNKQSRSSVSSKLNTISPSSSQSTSSSNSQLIDFSQPSLNLTENSRRTAGSVGLTAQFSSLINSSASTENTYFFHSDRNQFDGNSSADELNSSKKRSSKKKSSINNSTNDSQEQHAYANLSFNDAIVDEFL